MSKQLFASEKRLKEFFTKLNQAKEKRKSVFYSPDFRGLEDLIKILHEENKIAGWNKVKKKGKYKNEYRVCLKYPRNLSQSIINKVCMLSRRGYVLYVRVEKLQKIKDRKKLNELGIVRTRFGFVTAKGAERIKVGGEMLLSVS